MMDKDAFSQWLGIQRIHEDKGEAIIKMTVRPEMLNGFGVAHGGITFSFADSAFAFASNGQGRHAVSIETSISHVMPVYAGDELTAVAQELNKSHRLAIYEVTVSNQSGDKVALFKGTVYRKKEHW
ncbi:UNVERIFIED_CONTAM: hypothetical protein GTU68_062859 [Idotea baltica]|nr:hypothetical protein [Idotea baltica]